MSDVVVEYAEGPYEAMERPPRYPYGQGADGYGRKIATEYMVRFAGRGRLHRVYAVCFSNVASFYVVKGGKTLYLRGSELETALGR